jgi:hypothetical protein
MAAAGGGTDFWQNSSLEPKRAFKFLLRISGNQTFGVKQFLIKKVTKPSFTISESEHKYLNHSFYFPGKVTWNEISFTIVDTLGMADGTASMVRLFKEMGYDLPSNPDAQGADAQAALRTISKKSAVAAMGQIEIVQLDSDGIEREIWKLNGAWFKDVKFGDLDYDSEDMLNVEVSVRYDNADLKSSGGSNDPAPKPILGS